MAEGEQDGGKSACSLGFHLDRKRYLLLRPEQFSQLCVERSQTITLVLVLVLLRFGIG